MVVKGAIEGFWHFIYGQALKYCPNAEGLNELIYQLILGGIVEKQFQIFKKEVLRYPRLDTVLMIEKAVTKAGGDYTLRGLWKKLPKKVMWQTYMAAMDYLEYSGKILIDNEKHPIWIWAPREIAELRKKGLMVR